MSSNSGLRLCQHFTLLRDFLAHPTTQDATQPEKLLKNVLSRDSAPQHQKPKLPNPKLPSRTGADVYDAPAEALSWIGQILLGMEPPGHAVGAADFRHVGSGFKVLLLGFMVAGGFGACKVCDDYLVLVSAGEQGLGGAKGFRGSVFLD